MGLRGVQEDKPPGDLGAGVFSTAQNDIVGGYYVWSHVLRAKPRMEA